MPAYGECGGLMYLARGIACEGRTYEMVGAIPGDVVVHGVHRPVAHLGHHQRGEPVQRIECAVGVQRGERPVVARVERVQQVHRLGPALPATVAADGRIHTDFQQTVAATGRLSSTNPNLQNIPVRTDTGRDIRRAFVASTYDDPWFVAGDYSQIELRVLAHVTKDEGLVSAFLADQDIHRATAATVYGVTPGDVTRQMRDTAKMVNFGIAYGMGEFGLASRTGMTREEAEAFITTSTGTSPASLSGNSRRSPLRARRVTPRRCSAAAATSPPSAARTSRSAPPRNAKPSTCPSRAPPPTSSRSR